MTQSSRLLFVAPSAYPLGGVQTWLDYLLPGLRNKGWEPILGLVGGRWHDVPTYERAHPGHSSISIINRTGSHEGRMRAILRAVRRTAPTIVVGVNIVDSYEAVACMRWRSNSPPKVVMSIHGIQPDLFEDVSEQRDVLDGVVCTNQLSLRLALAHGMEPARLHYAPYGVEIPSASLASERHPSSRLRLAFVGRLEQWQKRVGDLPGILQSLMERGTDFELLVAGVGPAESELRRSLSTHVSDGRVRFLGSLSSEELSRQVYSKADALLLTSTWETGPIVIWEAMAHGLVVVSSRYVGSGLENQLHDDQNCLLFPIGDVAQAADRISQLSESALRRRLAFAGYQLVAERYSHARSIAAWDNSFRAILAAPSIRATRAPVPAQPAGRLDSLFGPSNGETIRSLAGIRFNHQNPGGEWPHSRGTRRYDDSEFWRQAAEVDTRLCNVAQGAGGPDQLSVAANSGANDSLRSS